MDGSPHTPDELRNEALGWSARVEELPIALPPVAPFAEELLPVALRPWISDIAQRMQCPPDYPAVASIIALASVVGRQMAIRPKARDDWTVVANLWGAVIGRPALLKTPAIAEPLRMVAALEALARQDHEQAAKDFEADVLVREALTKDAKARIARAVKEENIGLAQAIAAESLDSPEAPARRRFLTQDSTVEKLGELLRDNPRGILIFRDELVGFLKVLDQEGREGSRAFYLEAWNGNGAFTFDRIGRGTVEIPAACVSIIGAIQPGPLRDYLSAAVAGGAGDDGLLQRFQLAVWPDPSREWVNIDQWPDTAARQAARAVFTRLDSLDPLAIGARQEEGDPVPWLRFDPEAQDAFNGWRQELEYRLRDNDLHPALESHLAKFRSLVPSLALLCHLADHPEGGAVDAPSLLRALTWGEYLETHARRVYSPALTPEFFSAIELHRRLPSLPEPFTAKEVYKNHWRSLDIRGTKDAIQVLLDFGHIREEETEGPPIGRPTTRYEVHPAIRRTGR